MAPRWQASSTSSAPRTLRRKYGARFALSLSVVHRTFIGDRQILSAHEEATHRVRRTQSPVPTAVRRPSGRGRCRGQHRRLGRGAVRRPARARHLRPEDRVRPADRGPERHARPAARVQLQDPVPRGHRPARRVCRRRAGSTAWAPSRTAHGGARLVRNHECSPTAHDQGAVRQPERTYDPAGAGGTSTLVVDRHRRGRIRVHQPRRHGDQLLRRHHAVAHLADLRGDRGQGRRRTATPRTTASSSRSTRTTTAATTNPTPLKAMGRFQHEAVAVDPRTGHRLRDRGRVRRAARQLLPLPAEPSARRLG